MRFAKFKPNRWRRRLLKYVIFAIIVLISTQFATLPGSGQLPSLVSPDSTQAPPTGVERQGTLEATWVNLDGKDLFKIASPAVFNRSEPRSQIPVEVRAQQIEANLAQVIENSEKQYRDPENLKISVETLNQQPVLLVKDRTIIDAKVLLTVTNSDAQYHATSQGRLAQQWQKILEQALQEALELRQPEAFQQQINKLVKVVITIVLLTAAFYGFWIYCRWRRQQLEKQKLKTSQMQPLETKNPKQKRILFQGFQDYLSLERRLQILQLLQWLMFWAIAFVWVSGVAYSLDIFPQTRQFAERVITVPVAILMTWFSTGLINRLTDLLIDRFIQDRQKDLSLTEANIQRVATIANVIKSMKMGIIYSVAILLVLQWLKLVTGSILALGALVALAFSFAAQSLVKDLVNGFLILLEDQFRIEDYVKIGTAMGQVENLNLRITQIRTDDGNLITVPNSLITQVENMTRTWARTDFQIEVAYNTDVDLALAVVQETVDNMVKDPKWGRWILDTQELFGVDRISHSGILIRMWIKTAPMKQWAVARELRRRLKIAFDLNKIQIGIPQQVLLKDIKDDLT